MKRIGAFVGKFYPPHIGHLEVIDKVSRELDELYVIISQNPIRNLKIKEQEGFDVLDANLIKNWLELHYRKNKKIKVCIFDENTLRPYPQDQHSWSKIFKKCFPTVNVKVADASYREFNNKYFSNYEFYEINRDNIPIHSTVIRADLKQNFQYLIPEAKKYFLGDKNETI